MCEVSLQGDALKTVILQPFHGTWMQAPWEAARELRRQKPTTTTNYKLSPVTECSWAAF